MAPETQTTQDHLLSKKQYDFLNALAVLVLPALGTLYFALAQIWGLPDGAEVVGTIVAIDTCLGGVMKVGEASYDNSGARYSGALNVANQAEKTVYSLELNHAPEELVNKDHVVFKVNKPLPPPSPPVMSFPLNPSPPALPPATS